MTWSGPSGTPDDQSAEEPSPQPPWFPSPLPGYAEPGYGGRAPAPWIDASEPDVSWAHVQRMERRLRRAQIVIIVLVSLLVAACAGIIVLLVS